MDDRQRHRRAIVIEPDDDEDEDQVDFIRLRKKKVNPEVARQSRISIVNNRVRQSYAVIEGAFQTLDQSILSFITLKVFLWDIIISLSDSVTDFVQGYTLFQNPLTRIYGIVSLCINWVPGLAASFHLISMHRTSLPCQKVFLYALLLFIFYPLVPLCSFVYLLYKKPKTPQENVSEDFVQAQFFTIIVNAISGGLESPIQLVYQVWLVLNGVIELDWNEITSLSFTDWQGNTIYLPYTASLCITFSVVAILKAVQEFNVSVIHSGSMKSWMAFLKSIPIYYDFLPFLASAAFFRIAALIGIMTYLNVLGFIPFALMILANIIINQFTLKGEMDKLPNWLILFMASFVPACFSIKSTKNLVKIQKRTLFWQSLSSFVIYGASIIAILVMINDPGQDFKYNPSIILNNQEFNVYAICTLVMGFLSLILSMRLRSSAFLGCCENGQDEDTESLAVFFKFFWSLLMMFAVSLPIICSSLMLNTFLYDYHQSSFVYYKPGVNETRIVKATTIHPFEGQIEGFLKPYWYPSRDDPKVALPAEVKMNTNRTGPVLLGKFPRTENDIVAIQRQSWDDRKEEILDHRPAAILIIDDEQFRPSSPLPKFMPEDSEIPVLLIRKEDESHFICNDNIDRKIKMPIWLASDYKMIRDPEFMCDHVGCLPLDFNQGYIKGTQYRTKTCHWGGQACPKTVNEQEVENYCNGHEIQVCPLNDLQGFGIFKSQVVNGFKRTLRSSPPYCVDEANLNFLIRDCDRGTNAWTFWLGWEIETEYFSYLRRSKRRYCYLKNRDCLFEEKKEGDCCKEEKMCPDLPLCFLAPLS